MTGHKPSASIWNPACISTELSSVLTSEEERKASTSLDVSSRKLLQMQQRNIEILDIDICTFPRCLQFFVIFAAGASPVSTIALFNTFDLSSSFFCIYLRILRDHLCKAGQNVFFIVSSNLYYNYSPVLR
jgi:hypothetical protein